MQIPPPNADKDNMRVLVTGSSMFFTARLIQGLSAHGIDVTAADHHWWSVGKSIPRTKWLCTPSLAHNPAGYLSALVQELKSRPYDLLLPTFEESLLLAEFREEVESLTSLLLPPFEMMWRLHDKTSLYDLCCELEIPTPPTVPRLIPDNLESQLSGLRFPLVLKLPTSNNSIGREYCSSMPEFIERFHLLHARESRRRAAPPFVQQKIPGETISTLILCFEGRKLGEVIYRPLRCFPENGGTSSHRESIVHPKIAELTERLAAATHWNGFLGLDFVVDCNDGTPFLIDANPRESGSSPRLSWWCRLDGTADESDAWRTSDSRDSPPRCPQLHTVAGRDVDIGWTPTEKKLGEKSLQTHSQSFQARLEA